MEIVINIPDELRRHIDWLSATYLIEKVKKGTTLPKGHGRLIDADKLKDQIIEVKLENVSRDIRVITGCQLEESPTILEADEGVNEE